MSGVFFEVFLLISVMALAVTLFAFWKQKLAILPVGVVLFVLAGALLLSQGLEYESGGTFDQATGIITYNFSTVTASEPGILLVGWSFVGIGIILSIMAFRLGVQGGES